MVIYPVTKFKLKLSSNIKKERLFLSKIKSVFLAGSIDNGSCENWQEILIKEIDHKDLVIYNPRRKDWNSSIDPTVLNPELKEQVDWELTALEKSDLVVMYFAPGSISPISLLELGLFHKKCIVCCPEGFWRRGNVQITCDRYNITILDSMDDLIKKLKEIL